MSRVAVVGCRLCAAMAGLSIGVFAFAPPASAQFAPEARVGSRIPQKAETASRELTTDTIRNFAECVVKRQPMLARKFVLDRTTLQFDGRYRGLADGYCLSYQADPFYDEIGLKMGGDSMRFALADALLKSELPGIDTATLAAAAPLGLPTLHDKDYQPETSRSYTQDELKNFDEARRRDLLALVEYRFGECVVRADPQGSRAFLQASVNSGAETAGLQALMPALSSCVEKGAQFKLDRTILRGSLAFAYYNLAHAPRAVQAEAEHH